MRVVNRAIVLAFTLFTLVWAQVPQFINYQGVLTDTNGDPVEDGNYVITFSLWTAETGGVEHWNEPKSVPVANGLFNHSLGSVVAFSTQRLRRYIPQ